MGYSIQKLNQVIRDYSLREHDFLQLIEFAEGQKYVTLGMCKTYLGFERNAQDYFDALLSLPGWYNQPIILPGKTEFVDSARKRS